jgi:hypothetical protein
MVADLTDPDCENNLRIILRLLSDKNISLMPVAGNSDHRFMYKKTIIVANKYDEPDTPLTLEQLRSQFPEFPIIPISVYDDQSLTEFKKAVFDALKVIRIFTKRIGHEPEFHDPIILAIDSTVGDAALLLHKDFAHKLQFAKIWGKGKFEGQKVKSSFILSDEDIIEFHI